MKYIVSLFCCTLFFAQLAIADPTFPGKDFFNKTTLVKRPLSFKDYYTHTRSLGLLGNHDSIITFFKKAIEKDNKPYVDYLSLTGGSLSGDLLVGTTNYDVGGSVDGVRLMTNGQALIASSATGLGSFPLYLDRRGTNNTGISLMLGMGGYYKAGIGVLGTNTGADDAGITFSTISANVSLVEQMRIQANGNVGIGTTSPQEVLHIRTSAAFTPTTSLFGGGGSLLNQGNEPAYALSQDIGSNGYQTGSETAVGGMGFIYINASDYNNLRIGTQSNSKVIFRSNNLDRMAIDVNGYVGIGTNSPSEQLSVNGTILTKKLKVTQLGWSDYVFNDDYRLLPISDLAQYIQKNHRLPEVPSEKEVAGNGIDVGDNQALLLKKIEELTLYMIDMNKKLEEANTKANLQEKEIAQLKSRIK